MTVGIYGVLLFIGCVPEDKLSGVYKVKFRGGVCWSMDDFPFTHGCYFHL